MDTQKENFVVEHLGDAFDNKAIKDYGPIEINRIAKICHEVNRQWCLYNEDDSQPDWDDAPEWQKNSAVNGVIYHINNPEADDADSHINWMAEKEQDGWIYGTVKDTEAKTHPCIVPYMELSEEHRFKDRLFRTIVHASM